MGFQIERVTGAAAQRLAKKFEEVQALGELGFSFIEDGDQLHICCNAETEEEIRAAEALIRSVLERRASGMGFGRTT